MRAIGKQPGIQYRARAWATPAQIAVIVFATLLWTIPTAQAERRILTYDDSWIYDGEVKFDPNLGTCARAICPRYCRLGYCAHGTGHLGADGGWWYDGTFVDGMMHGRGRYENDFYIYTGGFKNNEFDGKGGLKCLDGPWYETRFAEGSLIEFRSSGYPVETQIKPGERVGWQGPCE